MLMVSCQNLAHYLLISTLTRYVGNLIIHCSLQNMYSKYSIFYFLYFIFLVEYQERNGIYTIQLNGVVAKTQMEKKNPIVLLKCLICGVQLKQNSYWWVMIYFQRHIFIFHIRKRKLYLKWFFIRILLKSSITYIDIY